MYNVRMDKLRFEWDEDKEISNIRKHSISFEEAQTVFSDEFSVQFFDPDHSLDEDRFILLGLSLKLRILIVCHCFRKDDLIVRIISARKANSSEEANYWEIRR